MRIVFAKVNLVFSAVQIRLTKVRIVFDDVNLVFSAALIVFDNALIIITKVNLVFSVVLIKFTRVDLVFSAVQIRLTKGIAELDLEPTLITRLRSNIVRRLKPGNQASIDLLGSLCDFWTQL